MKKSLIFCSIFIVAFIAFWDAKDRFSELEEVAANTPSQVEMNQTMKRPLEKEVDRDKINTQINQNKIQNQIQENKQLIQNNYDKVQDRRNSITNPVD